MANMEDNVPASYCRACAEIEPEGEPDGDLQPVVLTGHKALDRHSADMHVRVKPRQVVSGNGYPAHHFVYPCRRIVVAAAEDGAEAQSAVGRA